MNLVAHFSRSLILIFFTSLFTISANAASLLYMNSEPGDYIGQGQEWNISDVDHTLTATKNYDNGVNVNINGTTWWTLSFAAPGDVLLAPGAYENATRFPFQSPTNPGLSVSGMGRGCNTLTGRFVIHEVVYTQTNDIASFAADFEQHCSDGIPALTGSIRINSDVPINVAQPTASAGPDQYAVEEMLVTLDGSNSSASSGGTITSYHWTQIGGPSAALNTNNAAVANFIAPEVNLGGETLVFNLQVSDSSGTSATDTVSINVASKSDPRTYIHMNSEAGDYIGQGQSHDFNQNNGVISVSGTNLDEAKLTYQSSDYWSFNFAAPQGTGLSVGEYTNATRYPFQSTIEPGLSVSGAGRGCNTLTGSFNVFEIARNANNELTKLAADFEQHCEGLAPALFGQVRFNYVDPSVPIANAGSDTTVASQSPVTLNAQQSSDNDGYIVGYEWSQLSGIPVNISNPSSSQPSFITPTVPAGTTETLEFEVVVKDNLGFKAKDTVAVTVIGMDVVSYCDSSGTNTNYEWIQAVNVGTLSNTSGKNGGYADFSNLTATDMTAGSAVNISLTPGFAYSSYNEYWAVWIDLNHNQAFDSTEKMFSGSSRSILNGSINIPADALKGETGMRISMRYGGTPTPCGNFYYGEVEDYTVNIQ